LINASLVLGTTAASGTYVFRNSSTTGGQTLTLAGDITGGIGGAAAIKTFRIDGAGNGVVSGAITNGGATAMSLLKEDAGTWNLTGSNSLGGTATVQVFNGTLGIGNDNALNGASTLDVRKNISAVGGAHTIGSGVALVMNGDMAVTGSNDITFNGTVSYPNSKTLTVSNTGVTTFGGSVTLGNSLASVTQTMTGNGVVKFTGNISNGTGVTTGNISYSSTSGTIVLSGTNTYTGTTAVSNTGASLLVNGSHTGGGNYAIGGKLGGTGSIGVGANTVTIQNTGALAPGDSTLATAAQTGTLDITASTLTLNNSASIQIQIGGATPADGQGSYDQVNVTGAISLGAATITLSLSRVNGYAPQIGDFFYLVSRSDAGTWGTKFSGMAEGSTVSLGGSVTAQITYLANWTGTQAGSSYTGGNDVALMVLTTVPEPATVYAACALFGVVFVRVWKRRRMVSGPL
jgi:autotransporter-associated beta strand protein